MDDTSLDSILNDEPTPEAPEPAAPQTGQSDRTRDPATGKFVSASDPGDENPEVAPQPAPEAAPPAAPQDADQGHIPVAALRDERQKRQQAEDQLRQYEAYFTSLQQQPQTQQPAEVPDMYADPQGYAQWLYTAVREGVMQEVQQQADQFGTMTRAQVDEMMARQKYPDYDSKLEVIREAAKTNPHIVQEIYGAAQPAEKAMQIASNILAAREMGSATLPSRDDLKAEIRAELMAELNLSPKPTAPSSLASHGSLNVPRSGPAWSGPSAIGDILR